MIAGSNSSTVAPHSYSSFHHRLLAEFHLGGQPCGSQWRLRCSPHTALLHCRLPPPEERERGEEGGREGWREGGTEVRWLLLQRDSCKRVQFEGARDLRQGARVRRTEERTLHLVPACVGAMRNV